MSGGIAALADVLSAGEASATVVLVSLALRRLASASLGLANVAQQAWCSRRSGSKFSFSKLARASVALANLALPNVDFADVTLVQTFCWEIQR